MSGRAWWLSAAALLLLLAVSALGVAVTFLDPNDYKPQIVAAVQQATGRTLSLGGPLRISRSLWPTIEVTDVTLANLPGGTRPDLARAERIEAQLSLPALLRRRIEVSKLTLEEPNILFEFVGGKPNWVLEPAAGSQTSLSGLQVTLDIRQAHVRNGMVTVRLPTRTHVVGIRSLDLRHPTADAPLDLGAVLVYSDYQPFSLRASARPTGGVADPWGHAAGVRGLQRGSFGWGTDEPRRRLRLAGGRSHSRVGEAQCSVAVTAPAIGASDDGFHPSHQRQQAGRPAGYR